MIKVIDAIAGIGKTSWAIKEMNNMSDDTKVIYITPFLREMERIKKGVENKTFLDPSNKRSSKSRSFKDLLIKGENIATTHSLLKFIDDETIKLLKSDKYILILDEVLEVIEHVQIKRQDIEMLIGYNYIKVNKKGDVSVGDNKYDGKWNELINIITKGRVVCHNNTFFIWKFPVEVFNAFKDVYILTYMFDGSLMKPYFDSNNVKYTKLSVNSSYNIIDFAKPDLNMYGDLINIIEDHSINNIGDDRTALSYNWYYKKRINTPLIKKLKNNISNFKKNITKSPSQDFLWTTFKDKRKILEDLGFKSDLTFCPHNARSINEYAHKTTLAYTVNRFINPYLIKYFYENNIKINEDIFSVSEMIQWVFRSAIRNEQPINLYCPSSRMRQLFIAWIDGEM